jgi:predicted deacetylase
MHDVAPPSRERVERILDLLTRIGVTRRSLLVIPNLQGRFPVDQDDRFCRWLRQRRDAGDEIVLHGYEHVAVAAPRTTGERFRNRWFTNGEGEFLALDYDDARDRVIRGQAVLRRAGFNPVGFVAPAWLIGEPGLRAVRDIGFEYTNSYFALSDLARERSHVAPSLVFGPGRLNEELGIALQRRLARVLRRCPVVRVVVHPPCIDHDARMASIISIIEQQLAGREPNTYEQLLANVRAATATRLEHAH